MQCSIFLVQNFNTMDKADTKNKTDFGTLRPFEPMFSSECKFRFLKSHCDENIGSKGLIVPKICLFLCLCLLHSIKVLVTTFTIKLFLFSLVQNFFFQYMRSQSRTFINICVLSGSTQVVISPSIYQSCCQTQTQTAFLRHLDRRWHVILM